VQKVKLVATNQNLAAKTKLKKLKRLKTNSKDGM
jgi:hypothetical protein